MIAGTAVAAVPASAAPRSAAGAGGPGAGGPAAAAPLLPSPHWTGRCRIGVYHLEVPQFFQLRLSAYRGCKAHGPGTFVTMQRWVRWDGLGGYGYGRWQTGTSRVRVWVHRPVWVHARQSWRYFSRMTIRTASHFRSSVTYASWSWASRQWILSH